MMRALSLVAVLLMMVAGCAHVPVPEEPLFYPQDMTAARLQYLTSFSDPFDVEPRPSKFLSFLIGQPAPRDGIHKPYGVAFGKGKLYVADTGFAAIHVIDFAKGHWDYFRPEGVGRLKFPICVTVDSDENLYVSDSVRGQVFIYNASGRFIGALGAALELKVVDVKVFGDKVYACDLKSKTVRVYSRRDHQFLNAIPRDSKEGKGALYAPTNLAIDLAGRIYVSDSGTFHVQVYDADGTFLRSIGRHGDGIGEFARNKGVAVDRESRVYVVDAAFQNVQIFTSEGQALLSLGDPGTGSRGELVLPAGITVDYENTEWFKTFAAPNFEIDYLVAVVNQYGARKINVYGFGHKR
ncbi:MAG: 6-bladed beta-propeller [bacterium]